jgi:flavin reductase (DIM6/NTAB) family NADH-FMN oxidoreductase RutF
MSHGESLSSQSILTGPDVLSLFWSPICAIGSHGPHGPNAQFCVSVFGAGIVPEQPRIMVILYNTNFTRDLILEQGTLAVTVLANDQAYLFEALGTRSGRSGMKLPEGEYACTNHGDAYFPAGYGLLECVVIEYFDLGDATAFLCAVSDRRRLSGEVPLARSVAMQVQSEAVLARWAEVQAAAQANSRRTQRWLL